MDDDVQIIPAHAGWYGVEVFEADDEEDVERGCAPHDFYPIIAWRVGVIGYGNERRFFRTPIYSRECAAGRCNWIQEPGGRIYETGQGVKDYDADTHDSLQALFQIMIEKAKERFAKWRQERQAEAQSDYELLTQSPKP